MTPHRLAESHALGHSGAHIVCCQMLHEVVFHHHGRHSKGGHHIAGKRQHTVHEQILKLLTERHPLETGAHQTIQREPLQTRPQIHQKHSTQRKARHRIAHENEDTAQAVKGAAVPQRLENTQRDGYQIGDECTEQAEIQGNRQAVEHHVHHGLAVFIREPQIPLQHTLERTAAGHHSPAAAGRRLFQGGNFLSIGNALALSQTLRPVGGRFKAHFPALLSQPCGRIAFQRASLAGHFHGGGIATGGSDSDSRQPLVIELSLGNLHLTGQHTQPLKIGFPRGFLKIEQLLQALQVVISQAGTHLSYSLLTGQRTDCLLLQHTLYRTAGHHAREEEHQQGDAYQRDRHHEQASENIVPHGNSGHSTPFAHALQGFILP